MFLSFFCSFLQLAHTPSIVALQDPQVYRGKLPSFHLYTSFSPPLLQVRSPGWHFMFLVRFYPWWPSSYGFVIGATLWRLTSSPPSAQKTHASDTPSLRLMLPVRPEFSSRVRTLPVRAESVPNSRTPLLHPELHSNPPFHPDLTSPLFSISQHPDTLNSPASSRRRQDYHTPTPSLLA